jgi:hypothetical protein
MKSSIIQKFKILDLFCKAGGASLGMFWIDPLNIEITGVDIEPQPRYPFKFIQSDFRNVDLSNYDFIWSSPPCQKFSRVTPKHLKENHPDYIAELRSLLQNAKNNSGPVPFIIENVPCSPLNVTLKLTGEMFNKDWNKERWFESNFFILQPGSGRRRYKPVQFINTSSRKTRSQFYYMNHNEYSNAVPIEYSHYILSSYLESQKNLNRASKVIHSNCFPREGF